MTPARIAELTALANRHGSANCWTGTSGTLAAAIHELLAELTWTRVTDGLPPNDAPVLVNCPNECVHVWVGYWDGTEWISDGMPIDVVAWRELPEGITE